MDNVSFSTLLVAIFAILWSFSEFLSLFPKIKSNGVFQFIYNTLVWIKNNIIKKN